MYPTVEKTNQQKKWTDETALGAFEKALIINLFKTPNVIFK